MLSPAVRNADPRILKSQLDVIAAIDRSAWIVTPAWALILGLIASNALIPSLGAVPLAQALFFPLAISMASFATYSLYDRYRAEAPGALVRLQVWRHRFMLAQIAVSAAWGLLPWLLWEPGNAVNHMFLGAAVVSVVAALLVSRGSNMDMYLASLVPLASMMMVRFLFGDLAMDMVIGLLTPLVAVQMWMTGRPLIRRMEEDSRLRFKVEDLARELEETRDDALRKRFEAETANASKTAFLANMSHELRTPLNAILGFSEIIGTRAMGAEALERYCDYARDIHHSGTHLLSLINDLLDVAKIEAGKMEIDPRPLNPGPVLDSIARIMGNRLAAKKLRFTIVAAPGIPLLLADERALKQMLLNLLSNAVKFTPTGGHIAVTCGVPESGGMEFCVEDDGPGIAAEKLARIFQPFSQIDNRFDREAGGTGLGLALVQGLAHLHGGRAWLESEQGHGTRAYLYFPATLGVAPKRETA